MTKYLEIISLIVAYIAIVVHLMSYLDYTKYLGIGLFFALACLLMIDEG